MKKPIGINYRTRALRHRFGEHRRAIQHKTDDAVSEHFNLRRHKLADVEFIPLVEPIYSNRESVRRAREQFYIEKANTMQLHGTNRKDGR